MVEGEVMVGQESVGGTISNTLDGEKPQRKDRYSSMEGLGGDLCPAVGQCRLITDKQQMANGPSNLKLSPSPIDTCNSRGDVDALPILKEFLQIFLKRVMSFLSGKIHLKAHSTLDGFFL